MIFVSSHVIITSVTVPDMFSNLSLVLLLLLAGSLGSKFQSQSTEKKAKEKSGKRSDRQFGRWRDSFSSSLCFVF